MNKEIDARAGRSPSQVTVSVGENAVSMDQKEIIRVYTENRRVVISSISGRYVTRMTLQELELLLCEESFVRISRFEIVNLKKVSSFDLSMTGTIRIRRTDFTVLRIRVLLSGTRRRIMRSMISRRTSSLSTCSL